MSPTTPDEARRLMLGAGERAERRYAGYLACRIGAAEPPLPNDQACLDGWEDAVFGRVCELPECWLCLEAGADGTHGLCLRCSSSKGVVMRFLAGKPLPDSVIARTEIMLALLSVTGQDKGDLYELVEAILRGGTP